RAGETTQRVHCLNPSRQNLRPIDGAMGHVMLKTGQDALQPAEPLYESVLDMTYLRLTSEIPHDGLVISPQRLREVSASIQGGEEPLLVADRQPLGLEAPMLPPLRPPLVALQLLHLCTFNHFSDLQTILSERDDPRHRFSSVHVVYFLAAGARLLEGFIDSRTGGSACGRLSPLSSNCPPIAGGCSFPSSPPSP